jgi:hypothetical protein
MILTIAAMGMMQVPVDQVIDVIAVRHCLVPATGSMSMALFMATAVVVRSCGRGISRVDGYHVLVYVSLMQIVHVSVVKIIRVPLVLNRGMSASRAMLMGVGVVSFTLLTLCHRSLLPGLNQFALVSVN